MCPDRPKSSPPGVPNRLRRVDLALKVPYSRQALVAKSRRARRSCALTRARTLVPCARRRLPRGPIVLRPHLPCLFGPAQVVAFEEALVAPAPRSGLTVLSSLTSGPRDIPFRGRDGRSFLSSGGFPAARLLPMSWLPRVGHFVGGAAPGAHQTARNLPQRDASGLTRRTPAGSRLGASRASGGASGPGKILELDLPSICFCSTVLEDRWLLLPARWLQAGCQ